MEVNATLGILLCLFLGLLVWLSKFLFRPMMALFEERERRIEGARAEAQALQREAQQRLEEIEARIQAAQKEARLALLALQAEGARFHREILEAAKKESAEQMRLAQASLKTQAEQIQQSLEGKQEDFSKQVLGRLLADSGPSRRMEQTHA